MWKNLYDSLLQILAGPWAKYLSENGAQGRLVRDTFFNSIYPYSGLILIGITLIAALLFYFYFNNRFGKYYKVRTWFLWMLFSSLIIGICTFILSKSFLSSFMCPTNLLIIWQCLINLLYGLILFFVLSLVIQAIAIIIRKLFHIDLSSMGSRTPF